MLRTLRLRLADRPEFNLSFEPTDDRNDPWELLKSRADPEGRIRLGDRESCSIDEVLEVTVVEPERLEGPTWERGLQDEDVATALDENYDAPS
jgi:hypothetical protein